MLLVGWVGGCLCALVVFFFLLGAADISGEPIRIDGGRAGAGSRRVKREGATYRGASANVVGSSGERWNRCVFV